MDLVYDHLAGKEMEIGRFYIKKNNPIAAIKRFQEVIDHYQTTSHVPEALYRLVESCMMLGLKEDAMKYAAVLGHNYPESSWYKHSYGLMRAK
jgi:outer membrane protein assembly factor BamD